MKMCECTFARETREAEKRSVKNIMDVQGTSMKGEKKSRDDIRAKA